MKKFVPEKVIKYRCPRCDEEYYTRKEAVACIKQHCDNYEQRVCDTCRYDESWPDRCERNCHKDAVLNNTGWAE